MVECKYIFCWSYVRQICPAAKWRPWSCFAHECFGKIPASRLEKGNLKVSVLMFLGNLDVFTKWKKKLMGHVYIRRQITSHFGSKIHESRSPFIKIHVSRISFSLIHVSRVNPFTRMQTRRNWSINRCSTGETFLIALSKSALRLLKFEPRWYTWGLKKKNEKGMLRSDICEKEDNHKFFKNSSETRTFVSVTLSKLPF